MTHVVACNLHILREFTVHSYAIMIRIEKHTTRNDPQPLRTLNQAAPDLPVYAVRQPSGWKTLDSPYRPVEESREALSSLQAEDRSVIVFGLGSGFIVRELLQHALQRMLLITASSAVAEHTMKWLSRAVPSHIDCCVLVADCITDPVIGIMRRFIQENPTARVVRHPRETRIFFDFFEHLHMYSSMSRTTRPKKIKQQSIRRVLLPCSGQLFEPDICDVLKRNNIKVIPVEAFTHKTVSHEQVLDILHDSTPDLVLSTNNKGSDRYGLMPGACTLLNIPWATWFLDEPGFIVSPTEGTQRQRRAAFCWDVAGLDACRALGFSSAQVLPLAGNPKIFSPGRGDASLRGRIVYVGSPGFGNEHKYFAGLCNDRHAMAVAALLENSVQTTRRIPQMQNIRECMRALSVSPDYFPRVVLDRLPAFVVYRANISYRVQALASIADMRPVVYGEGWDGLLPDTVELRSYVDYYRDLVSVYRSDAVHLSLTHLQMRRYPNQRIFDAGLCARPVLGERLPGTEELFGAGVENLHFENFEQLREKAEALIHNAGLRDNLGGHLREVILRQHTLDKRIDQILQHTAASG